LVSVGHAQTTPSTDQLLKAKKYTLYINGRSENSGAVGDYYDWSYWGGPISDGGLNKRAVNWNGKDNVASTNAEIRKALDCFCTGNNWCNIVAHSAGNLQLGYALANFGASDRLKMSGEINHATKQCIQKPFENRVWAYQKGWNIRMSAIPGGAAGGSALANIGSIWLGGINDDLVTSTARKLYDHNLTRGTQFNMFAGAKGKVQSGLIPGQDDGAVGYDSAGGVSGSTGVTLCNPGNIFCSALTLMNDPAIGRAKWNQHYVRFRDDSEQFDHFANKSWGGIISKAREFASVHFSW
jgi:hypothetical protein